MSFKRCFKCLETKPMDSFYKHAQMSDGRLNKCKECSKKEIIKNRKEKIEYYRSYDKARASNPNRVAARKAYSKTAQGKAAHARAIKKMREKFPEKSSARRRLKYAVETGKVSRDPCFVCGDIHVEGHHPAYSLPLNVVWLCKRHHSQLHKEAREFMAA